MVCMEFEDWLDDHKNKLMKDDWMHVLADKTLGFSKSMGVLRSHAPEAIISALFFCFFININLPHF